LVSVNLFEFIQAAVLRSTALYLRLRYISTRPIELPVDGTK